jgi:hypothetical protein
MIDKPKPTTKPRNAVITVRPSPGARTTTWQADCGDCGPLSLVKPFKDKGAAMNAGTRHGNEAHGGAAVLHVRQR